LTTQSEGDDMNQTKNTQRHSAYGKTQASIIAGLVAAALAYAPWGRPVTAEVLPPATWEEFDEQASALAPTVSLLAAEIADGVCKEIRDLNAGLTTPIGSSFKLYIVAELADQVSNGVRSWEALLEIEAQFKSVPEGPLLFVPDGSKFSTRYIAEQMIERSDNTATDHLLFLAGRKYVEARMALMGHHDPSLNVPLLSTREFAIMKFLWNEAQLQDYEAATVAKRREILATEKRGWPAVDDFFEKNGDQALPVHVESVEWFANRFDICSLLISLDDMSEDNEGLPVLEVLALRDPIDFDREQWTYVGFKGGSEIGLLAGNWLVRRNDGRLFIFSVAFLDPQKGLDQAKVLTLLRAAPDILFNTP